MSSLSKKEDSRIIASLFKDIKEDLINLLKQKGISYEDEISNIESIDNEALIALLDIKTLNELKKNSNNILIKSLNKLYKEQYITDFTRELLGTDNYLVFYFMLCNSILSEDKAKLTEEEILNKVYIALIKIFIKKNKIFDFRLVHKSRINLEIKINTLEELLKKVGYKEDFITSIEHFHKNNNYMILWYVLNKTKDEIKFSFTLEDLLVKILELFILRKVKLDMYNLYDHKIFRNLYNQIGSIILESNGYSISTSRSLLTTIPYLKEIKKKLLDTGTYTQLLSEDKKLEYIYMIWNLELKDLLKIQRDALRFIDIDDNNVAD